MAWPGGELLFSSYSEDPPSAVLRTPMEDGYSKQRRVVSKRLVPHSVQYEFDAAGYAAWITWFEGTEARLGAGFFDWLHPRTGETVQGRMVEGKYTVTPVYIGGDQKPNWLLSTTIEVYM